MNTPPASRKTGGDVLVDLMKENGLDTAFGVVSIHNLPLVEAIDRELHFVPVRHEAAAVNAADGYSRATGKVGIAITSTGTGAGNAAGSMLEALSAGSRVLHVTGQIDSEFLGSGRGVIHEVPRQAQMLDAISRFSATIRTTQESRRVLAEALADVTAAPYAPASVEWPIDLQYLADPADQDDAAPGAVPESAGPGEAQLAEAVRLLEQAERPLVWAGGGACEIGDSLTALIDRLGAGLLTSNAGRGSVPEDHDLVLGNFASNPGLDELIASADLLLSIGTHFRSNETRTYRLQLPTPHIAIDIDPAAIGRVYPATVGLPGDARTIVPALLERLGARADNSGWTDQVTKTRHAVRQALGDRIGAYDGICASIRARLPRESVVARDVTIPSSSWGNRLLDIYDPRTNVFPLGGGIGQGLAMGIGAALGRPDVPTLIMAGDGGLAVHLGELGTLAGTRSQCVLVVFNDGGYGVLRNLQETTSGRTSGVDLFTPDFGRLASAYDMPYELVRTAPDFDTALANSLEYQGPSVIEVDVTTMTPAPAPFTPPVHVPTP